MKTLKTSFKTRSMVKDQNLQCCWKDLDCAEQKEKYKVGNSLLTENFEP